MLRTFKEVLFSAFLLSLLLRLPAALGTMVLPLDLRDMTDQAGKIFVGRCLESSSELDERGIPATYARFRVQRGLKGAADGEEILVKQFGIEKEPLRVGEGERAVVPIKSMTLSGKGYREGEDYLLFFYPESSLGFTSPVGGGQGKFLVSPQKTGGEPARTAINPLGNRFLKGFSLPPEGGPVDLQAICDRVERMVTGR